MGFLTGETQYAFDSTTRNPFPDTAKIEYEKLLVPLKNLTVPYHSFGTYSISGGLLDRLKEFTSFYPCAIQQQTHWFVDGYEVVDPIEYDSLLDRYKFRYTGNPYDGMDVPPSLTRGYQFSNTTDTTKVAVDLVLTSDTIGSHAEITGNLSSSQTTTDTTKVAVVGVLVEEGFHVFEKRETTKPRFIGVEIIYTNY